MISARLVALFLMLFSLPLVAQYQSENMILHSVWNDTSIAAEPVYKIRYNGVWGYRQQNREYALLGASNGVHIIDVSAPDSPKRISFIPGRRDSCIWREIQTYRNYAYLISDDAAPNSLQIVDLKYLPDSVHLVYDSNELFERAHTLFINDGKLYCAGVKLKTGKYHPFAVYSLMDPVKPQFITSTLTDVPSIGSAHDMYVRNDTVYASCGFDGLYILKYVESEKRLELVNRLITYPYAGYNHSSTLTANGKTLIFADEVPNGLPVKVLDVSDIHDLKIRTTFETHPEATPHNVYAVGNSKVVIAYYQDGLQIFDISDPGNPRRTAYFDTYPQNGDTYKPPHYAGNWGAYPYLPSGRILASDMQNGLFILSEVKEINPAVYVSPLVVYPVPANGHLNFRISPDLVLVAPDYQLFDMTGKALLSGKIPAEGIHTVENFEVLSRGIYFLSIGPEVVKVIKN